MFIDYRNSSSKLNPRFALYLKDLFNHHKVLSPEVENALITKAKKDDDLEAKNLIILSHCRLYYRVSCKYAFYVQGSISQTEDFFNECFIAANKALDTYQIGRSKFSTWVLFYIKRQFIKYINENSRTITYPVSVYYASKRMENQEKAEKEKKPDTIIYYSGLKKDAVHFVCVKELLRIKGNHLISEYHGQLPELPPEA